MKKSVAKGMSVTPMAQVEQRIFLIRGQAVMLDAHLAELYGVSTGRLNEQVKRNIKRFPEDFMFQPSKEEVERLISQIAISSWGGYRKLPYAFTEQGVAMLSGVLRSDRAIQVNIEIMRAFIRMKKALIADKELARRMEAVEKTVTLHGQRITVLSDIVRGMIEPPAKPKRKIGFRK
jgi:uncharacterized membrane-anchored protein YjiN (DUF445 family)